MELIVVSFVAVGLHLGFSVFGIYLASAEEHVEFGDDFVNQHLKMIHPHLEQDRHVFGASFDLKSLRYMYCISI